LTRLKAADIVMFTGEINCDWLLSLEEQLSWYFTG
jgi:hypothetical protein